MSCSTGATLANLIAYENPDLIAGQVMYSPNFGLENKASAISNDRWGLQILRLMFGGKYRSIPGADANVKKYWTHKYRLEGLVLIVDLFERMFLKEKIQKINHPVFIGCYYKNEEEKDKIVRIDRMEQYINWISTPKNQKQLIKFDKVGGHVITNPIFSKDVGSVLVETEKWMKANFK